MNSKIVRIIMAVALALPLAAQAQTDNAAAGNAPASAAAPATTAPGPTKLGVISVQDCILATNEGQKEFEALGKKFEPTRNELKSLNDEIDGLKKQLDAQGSKMNEEARAGLVRQIETKQKALSRKQEDAQNDFVGDRKSTRLNSSHQINSYAVFCLKKKRLSRPRAVHQKSDGQ